jgi:hypothetical protein
MVWPGSQRVTRGRGAFDPYQRTKTICGPSSECSFFLARVVRFLARLRLPNSSVSLSLSLRRGAVGSKPQDLEDARGRRRASELECIIPNPGSAGVSRSRGQRWKLRSITSHTSEYNSACSPPSHFLTPCQEVDSNGS